MSSVKDFIVVVMLDTERIDRDIGRLRAIYDEQGEDALIDVVSKEYIIFEDLKGLTPTGF